MAEVTAFTYHSISEAARILNVSRGVVREMVAAERLVMASPAPGRRPRVTGRSILDATQPLPEASASKRPPKPVGDWNALLAWRREWGYE